MWCSCEPPPLQAKRSGLQADCSLGVSELDKDTPLSISVLGLGHVGLPTALSFAELGWPVTGADDDAYVTKTVGAGTAPFFEPGVQEALDNHLRTGNFKVSPDVATAIQETNVIFICVGTPQGADGSVDLTQLDLVAQAIAANLNGEKIVVEKSTSPVQTAKQIKANIQRYAGLSGEGISTSSSDSNIEIVVNPEFMREGKAMDDLNNPDRIILGVESETAKECMLRIYQPLLDKMGPGAEKKVVVTDVNSAEIIKHASNAFLATKISFINMIANLCEAAGADVDQVALGVGLDPRIGAGHLKAGVGYGGSCLPKDVRAFTIVVEQHGQDASLLKEVEAVNNSRVERLLEKARQSLGTLNGKTVGVWGLAFKADTDDVREASSLQLVDHLLAEGASLRLHDPQAICGFKRHHPEAPPRLTYFDAPEGAACSVDALMILTDWAEYAEVDLALIREKMFVPLILDGRNLLESDAVRKLGIEYYSIGRP